MQISEQTVLITGGGRGLGHAIVRAFAQQGARVVINYLRSRDPAEALAQELGGDRAIAVSYTHLDVYKRQVPH